MLNEIVLEKVARLAGIDPDELLNYDKLSGDSKDYIGKVLSQNEVIDEKEFQAHLSKVLKIEFAAKFEMLPEDVLNNFIDVVPYRFAYKHLFFPQSFSNGLIKIAVVNPSHISYIDEILPQLGYDSEIVLATESTMLSRLQAAYDRKGGTAEQAAEAFGEDDEFKNIMDLNLDDNEDLLDASDEEPIKKLVNSIIFQALRDGASDIHADPSSVETVIRVRVDGVLHQITKIPKFGHMPLLNRIKVMSGLDISTKNKPQDGRTVIRLGGRKIDIRVSVLPTVHGERAVLRLLATSGGVMNLEDLGFSDSMREKLIESINHPHGIFLVTGPTGSGKTTTLYAALQQLDQARKNIVTIEDPVEYQIQGYGQVQVNEKAGLTFAAGLRSILRQDPDIIMVGEIRDKETAQIAVQSALTGHMVFSTLHTNDTCSTIVRLIDMEIEPFLVSSSLRAILAQRLVRKICDKCKKQVPKKWEELQALGFPEKLKPLFTGHLWEGAGCQTCIKTGYSGRRGIFEFLLITDETKKMINTNPDASMIAESAGEYLIKMSEDGMTKVLEGITTLDEMFRVVTAGE